MNETRQLSLEELTDGTPITYGVVQPGDSPIDGVLFVRGGDIVDGQIDVKNLRRISSEISEQFRRTLLSGGEILVSLVGNPGQVALVPPELKGANIARQAALIRPNTALVNPKWLELFMRSPIAKQRLRELTGGAVQQVINLKELRSLTVDLPDLSIQHQVSCFIGSIEDKIENLKRQNTTLEALAQTLFRSWFVNFDPVHAKAAGQTPEGMSPELAALFPSEFVESELGMIPKGWSSPYMSDGFDFKEGPGIRNWQYTNSDEGTKFINIRCIQSGDLQLDTANRISDAEAFGKYNHFLLKEKDVVLSTSGTLGRTGLVRERHLPLCLNTSVIRFRQAELPMPFIKCFLESELFINELNSLASGSVQKNFGPSHVKQIRYIKPTQSVLEGFAHVVNPLFDKLICNRDLSDTLVQLRDELLPRLISGKLRIEEAEEAVSEVLGSTAEEEKAA